MLWGLVLALALGTWGCGSKPQRHSTTRDVRIALTRTALQAGGLGFLTPATVTGQEEDRQALELAFYRAVRANRPDVPTVSLSATLGAVNKAEIADEYKKRYEDYRATAVLSRDTLKKVGASAGVRCLALLNMAWFGQQTQDRFSILGLRVLQTKRATLRVFMQVWDTTDGTIVWEATHELDYARDTVLEQSIPFQVIAEEAGAALADKLP